MQSPVPQMLPPADLKLASSPSLGYSLKAPTRPPPTPPSSTSSILESFPEYETTASFDRLRATEYSYLDENNHVYLDYTGAGLAAKAQYQAHQARLSTDLFSNPHSANPTSQASTKLVEQARADVLRYLNAAPDTYTVIFTPNATGAARLIAESYPFTRTSTLLLTADNHNSVNGIREYARRRHARTVYLPLQTPSLRVDPSAVATALTAPTTWPWTRRLSSPSSRARKRKGLFAYPAQSNFSGVRHPLEWITTAQQAGYDVLLDAAAYLPTNRLDLSPSSPQPDFLLISWYKLFGFPTGLGCLVARKDALSRLSRPWFSGGTVQAVLTGVEWHSLATSEGAFEDGTVNFLSIPEISVGLNWLRSLGVDNIATRVRCLTGYCFAGLQALRHSDGTAMTKIYGPCLGPNNVGVHPGGDDSDTPGNNRGGTIAFNFLDRTGKIVDERIVARESAQAGISLRTGCFCNPGAAEAAFGITKPLLRSLRRRFHDTLTVEEYIQLLGLPSGGAVRVSFGLVSNVSDVDRFLEWARRMYRDRVTGKEGLVARTEC
ncbi:PLP-dependent transferase [Aspergillus homomorphus CBS 101889]|uniref:PLP-dependent transferase n=1 Tax=Aspergillus homomorphus (strain CBS 101889) TaxID=1450537 RepID=A0A395HJF2_ASPHC|nr:PLP-dependent transferase [Aspergillus homomorphus CBS 101889]RAL07900.1 PLP-dependent transferase [Aspergillus homomorphus CBS 101889]